MLIFITASILFVTALSLSILRITRPGFRFFWLIAVTGAFTAWLFTWLWLPGLPIALQLPSWEPSSLFRDAPAFLADGPAWALAIGLVTLALSILVTTVARQNYSEPLPWIGTLTLTGLGLLAVTANNPLTLVLTWAAIDLAELLTLLRSTDGPSASERVVTSFSARAVSIGLVLWANGVSIASGTRLDFVSMAPSSGLYLLVAAGLRLGVLPLHLPYSSDSRLRRGFGTALRLVSAAASLAVLARLPEQSVMSPFTPLLQILTAVAAVYGGWMWLRAPDELSGRPFWIIGMAALATAAALRADPTGSAAWSCALILSGAALFLASIQHRHFNTLLLLGALGMSGLPFTLTATGWQGSGPVFWPVWPLLLAAHAFLLTGFVRQALRPGIRESLDSQPRWVRGVYPVGILIILMTEVLLGVTGWDGAGQLGAWPLGSVVAAFMLGLLWAGPRFRIFNPIRAHWVRPAAMAWFDGFYRGLGSLYQSLGRLSRAVSATLEGDGGIMWALLFLALFVSFMIRNRP
jgi:hypothetical protein